MVGSLIECNSVGCLKLMHTTPSDPNAGVIGRWIVTLYAYWLIMAEPETVNLLDSAQLEVHIL